MQNKGVGVICPYFLGVTRTRQTTQLSSSGYYKITQTSGGLNSVIMAVADGSAADNAMYAVLFNIALGTITSVKMSTIIGTRALTLYQKHVNNDVYEIVMALNRYERLEIYGSTYLMQPTKVDSISGYTQITFS